MIILIGNSKGGEGKSTIATNLAAMLVNRGNDLLLIDADPQRSSYMWTQARNYLIEHSSPGTLPVSSVCMQGAIRPEVELQAKKYEYILIDTQGRASVELLSSAIIADMIIMPVTCGVFSAWALEDMDKVLEASRATGHDMPVNMIVNRASTNAKVDDRKEFAESVAEMTAAGKLNNLNPTILFSTIKNRTIYRTAASYGLAVEEMPENNAKDKLVKSKAVQEFQQLYDELFIGPPA